MQDVTEMSGAGVHGRMVGEIRKIDARTGAVSGCAIWMDLGLVCAVSGIQAIKGLLQILADFVVQPVLKPFITQFIREMVSLC